MATASNASSPADDRKHGDDGVPAIPRGILIGAAVMIVAAIVFAYIARTTDIGAVRLDPAPVVQSRDLAFITNSDGSIAIRDPQQDKTLEVLSPASDGFVKIVLRSVQHERKFAGVSQDQPFRLTRRENGQILLEDLGTHRIFILTAFGGSNAGVFSKFLD